MTDELNENAEANVEAPAVDSSEAENAVEQVSDEVNEPVVEHADDASDAEHADEAVDAPSVDDVEEADEEDASDDATQDDDSADDSEPAEDEVDLDDPGKRAVKEFEDSLPSLDGKWYVLHTYSGYEKRVKANVESRVQSFNLEDSVFQIEVPMVETEKVTDKGKKVLNQVLMPGYVLIRMWPDEDARRIVRDTEGVTGFVGPEHMPTPLTSQEVVNMMAPMIESEALKAAGDKPKAAKKRVVEVSYELGQHVTVTDGPFASMPGVISDIQPATQKLTVLVNIFGRDTPMELGFDQVEKVD